MSSTSSTLSGAVGVETVAVCLGGKELVLVLGMADVVRNVHIEWNLERTGGTSMVRGTRRRGIGALGCPQGLWDLHCQER